MNFLQKVVPVFGLVMVTILIAGLIQIHFFHHVVLPKEILNRNTILSTYELKAKPPFFQKRINIYLVDQITSYRQTQDVIEALNESSSNTVIVFHLAGFGGGVEQVERIFNAIHNTKATVVMQVEAPVYSGHAFLALAGDKLNMAPYTYLMLHTTSAVNIDCDKETGFDRGMSNKEHCEIFMYHHLSAFYKLVLDLPILTPEEKFSLLMGKDVYLTSEQVGVRQ